MTYSTEYDENRKIIKEYDTDEYGNIEITYIDELIKDINTFGLFTSVIYNYKLELSINKELYEKGVISKELYEKVLNKILEKMKPILAIIEV